MKDQKIESPRLNIRNFTIRDAKFILTALNEPSFIQYIADRKVRKLSDAEEYIRDRFLAHLEMYGFSMYLVELKESNEPIGMCGLVKREGLDHPDIGYAFLPKFWKNGYAMEAAEAVLLHAREVLGMGRIVAITLANNESSIKLLEKLGMSYQNEIFLPGDGETLLLYE